MKNVIVIHTGGTISMQEDILTGKVSTAEEELFLCNTSMVEYEIKTEEEILYNLPSPSITPTHMLQLAEKIIEKLNMNRYDGIVITHGTDTLEETAYFLDLYLSTETPVVVTGAMRSRNEIGSDGLYNLISSVRVASDIKAREKGVLVVMNDEIHTARYVTKTSTSNVATFQSPQFGPIGFLTKQAVYFQQSLLTKECYPVMSLTKDVALIKAYAGMDGRYIEAIHKAGIDGLVIEGLGQGNLPEGAINSVEAILQDNIPIVLVSRSYQGIVQPTYSYVGGGNYLMNMGVIFAHGLTGQKARVKLLFALELTDQFDELKRIFEI